MNSVSEADKTDILSVKYEELDANDLQQTDFITLADSCIVSAYIRRDKIIKNMKRISPEMSPNNRKAHKLT
jgi:hypothetical protein